MKCSGCGGEFENMSLLMKHKPVCPGMNGDTQVCTGVSEVRDEPEGECVIPLSLCPEELKYLALDATVGVRVEGKYTPDGIVVQEVKFIR